jgi:hypothetical protein
MAVICAWCNTYLGMAEECDRKGISHGMCPSCLVKKLAVLEARDGATVKCLGTNPPEPSGLFIPTPRRDSGGQPSGGYLLFRQCDKRWGEARTYVFG